MWFNTYTSKLFENATFCSRAFLFIKGHVEKMEWFESVSKSKVRSLSVSSNCYDKQHIIKPRLAKQNNFKYFAGYSQQLHMAGAASEWSTQTLSTWWNLLLAHHSVQTHSELLMGGSWHLPNLSFSCTSLKLNAWDAQASLLHWRLLDLSLCVNISKWGL